MAYKSLVRSGILLNHLVTTH